MVDQNAHQAVANSIRISVIDVPKKIKKPAKKDQPKLKENGGQPSYFVMFVSELLGTGLLMFLGCMGCVYQFDDPPAIHHMGGIAFGLTVMMIIQMFGHISGAHLNPAVTLATVILGLVKPMMAVVYVVAQFVGATLGFGLLKILLPEEYAAEGFCATVVNPKISVVQGLGIETVITTILILVCCAVWDKRNENKQDSTPLKFGLIIAVISIGAGPLTGASMNTARSFAPLVFGGNWTNHWIYWIGPNVAAIIGCFLYKIVFSVSENEDQLSKAESLYLDEVSPQSAGKA